MRKPNKRESIFGVVLVVAVFYTIGLDRQVASKRRTNNKYRTDQRLPIDEPRPSNKMSSGQPRLSATDTGRAVLAAEFEHWDTDPFSRPFALEEIKARQSDGEYKQELELKGVMFTKSGGAVMIGDKVYVEGDHVDRYVVVTITRHAVVLKDMVDGSRLRLEVD
jgi:hypothetical protein